MDENFLPPDYKTPVSPSNYMKWEDGDNRFRVLSSPILGWEYWSQDKKPVRSKTMWEETPADARLDEKGQFKPKFFWALVVWNYAAERVQILEITQKTIMTAIEGYAKNPKWGNPRQYDIVVTRMGEGFETEYTIMPEPKEPTPPKALEALAKMSIRLEALYDGADPFDVEM